MLRTRSIESAENHPLQPGLETSKEQSGQTHHDHEDHLPSDQINELRASESDDPALSLLQDESNPLQPGLEMGKDEAGPISIVIDSNYEEESIQQCFPKKTMLVLSSLQIICGCLAILLQVWMGK